MPTTRAISASWLPPNEQRRPSRSFGGYSSDHKRAARSVVARAIAASPSSVALLIGCAMTANA